jgi:glycosyltransferase involved in cell wall biosynthesis
MKKSIVLIGPKPNSRGGIASVIAAYFNTGLSKKWPMVFLPTYLEGGKLAKFNCAVTALVRFAGFLLQNKAALLHVHVASHNSFWRKAMFMQLAFLTRCPVLLHLHSGGFPVFYQNECGRFRKFLIRYYLGRVSALIVLTESWQSAYAQFKPKRIIVLPNFVELTAVNRAPTQPTLVFLGRLTREKGFFDLLQAVSLLKQLHPSLIVRAGGEGSTPEVASLVCALNIEKHISLEGWVEGPQKQELLCCATVFVLPSYVEAMPMGILEAMACGLPVIASRVGGIPDMIEHNVNGVLVDAGKPAELAEQIDRLLADDALREKLAKVGRQTVIDRYSVDAVVPVLKKLYLDFGIEPS